MQGELSKKSRALTILPLFLVETSHGQGAKGYQLIVSNDGKGVHLNFCYGTDVENECFAQAASYPICDESLADFQSK